MRAEENGAEKNKTNKEEERVKRKRKLKWVHRNVYKNVG